MNNFSSSGAAVVLLALLLSNVNCVLSGNNNFMSTSIGGPDRLLERFLQPNSNVTILNEGEVYTINEKFDGISFFGRNTSMVIESGAEIVAPENWAGIRLVTNSTLKMMGGSVQGWYGKPAVELHNGQSSDDTASYAEINDGSIVGGHSFDGEGEGGGDAFYIHGFGTKAKIFGGEFFGGIGKDGGIDGLSIKVHNFAETHIYSGTFKGEMEVSTDSTISFYGCFLQKNGATITGRFVDETELNVVVKTKNDGKVLLISVSEQECETAPSMSPTNFPTISPQPTPQISYGKRSYLGKPTLLLTFLVGLLVRG